MYRNPAQLKCIPSTHALPSPENTSESDSEFLDALDRKRRELDDEIARFKAAKDREFRDFEKELLQIKRRRSLRVSNGSELSPSKHTGSTPSTSAATASVLKLLASTQNASTGGWAVSKPRKPSESAASRGEDRPAKTPPPSKPTLSLETLSVTGETAPPLGNGLATPPTPSLLNRPGTRPSDAPATTTLPQLQLAKPPLDTPTPSSDRSDPFTGVFTPSFLPLLESREQSPLVRSPQPMSSAAEKQSSLQLDADSKREARKQLARQLQSSQSLPPPPLSSPDVPNKHSKSGCVLPSASLPSALRSAGGGRGGPDGRKRKHVMFQLADLKVVEPRSSYEEGPSPEFADQDEKHSPPKLTTTRDRKTRKNLTLLGVKETNKASRRGRAGRLASPMPSPLPSPNPSPVINGTSPSTSPSPSRSSTPSPQQIASPLESGFSGGLHGAADGGSGVGFFELDEELASPALRDGKPADRFDLELDEDISEKNATDGLHVGSVPIDIVRPSGSWVGSFGH